MDKIKESNIVIKSYFRDIIKIKTFLEAKKLSISFRSITIKNNYRINKSLNNHDMMMFLLLPLIYKYGNSEMDIPNNICYCARTVLIEYLMSNSEDEYYNESLEVYLNLMREYEKMDKRNLYTNLFANYYELLEMEKYIKSNEKDIDINSIWLESIGNFKETIYKYIKLLGAVDELQLFLVSVENQKRNIIFSILDKIYWNKFEKSLEESKYELLNLIIMDINKLFHDIINITKTKIINSEYINELLDCSYIETQIKYNLFDKNRIKNLAKEIFMILKKLDSKEFEILYEKINYELDDNNDDINKFLSTVFQRIYMMLLNIKNKIDIINSTKIL